jgi:hypothetical protein
MSEDAGARAERLTEGLRGLLKEELKEYGGADEFVHWVRSDASLRRGPSMAEERL